MIFCAAADDVGAVLYLRWPEMDVCKRRCNFAYVPERCKHAHIHLYNIAHDTYRTATSIQIRSDLDTRCCQASTDSPRGSEWGGVAKVTGKHLLEQDLPVSFPHCDDLLPSTIRKSIVPAIGLKERTVEPFRNFLRQVDATPSDSTLLSFRLEIVIFT